MLALLGGTLAGAADCGGARRCACGDRVVEDYRMAEDLGPCAGSGLRLVRRVSFDGGGHVIRGSGARGSVGLQVSAGASRSLVRDLEVTRFERGIRLRGTQGVELVAVRSHHNGDRAAGVGYGIDLADGSAGNVLDRVSVHHNADEGIHLGRGATANRITSSEIYENFRENVYVLAGRDNVIESCTIRKGGSSSIYVKNSNGTVVARSRIEGRPILVRGASVGTRLVDDTLDGAGVVLQPYADEKLGEVRPARTEIRGGSIVAGGACVRVDGARQTSLDSVALDCSPSLAVAAGGDVTAIDTRLGEVACAGTGEVRRARRVEVRLVGPGGRPLPGARIVAQHLEPADATLSAGADGVIRGTLVEARLRCPGREFELLGPADVVAGTFSRRVPIAELGGDLALGAPPSPAPSGTVAP